MGRRKYDPTKVMNHLIYPIAPGIKMHKKIQNVQDLLIEAIAEANAYVEIERFNGSRGNGLLVIKEIIRPGFGIHVCVF